MTFGFHRYSVQLHVFGFINNEYCIVFRGGSRISSQEGAHLKKLHRAEGGANIFEVFRVKNHDFMPKNLIFSNFRGGGTPDPPL